VRFEKFVRPAKDPEPGAGSSSVSSARQSSKNCSVPWNHILILWLEQSRWLGGPDTAAPSINALVSLEKMEVYVDLSGHIDVAAEVARNDKLLQNLVKQIAGKEKNLANENYFLIRQLS
jgi:valyl-tRNA synthetase